MFSAEGGPPPAPLSPLREAVNDGAPAAVDIEDESSSGEAPVAKKRRAGASSARRLIRYVSDVEFAGHGLRLVNDQLYCGTCCDFVGAGRRSLVTRLECAARTWQRACEAWEFWRHVKRVASPCIAWVDAAARIALLVPSSCDAERFFSTATGTTKRTQMGMGEDVQEIRHLLAFNPERTL